MAGARGTGSRARTAALLSVFALALALAELALYADHSLFHAGRFADRVEVALQEPEVQRYAAELIATEIVAAKPDLIAVEPVIRGATEGVVGSAAFGSLVRGATYQAHASAFGADRDTLALTLANAGLLVVEVLEQNSPQIAAQIPERLRTTLVSVSDGDVGAALTDLAQVAQDVRYAGWIALAIALLALGFALAPRAGRRETARSAGYVLAGVAGALAVGLLVARAIVGSGADGEPAEAAVRAVWDVFAGDLLVLNLALVASGIVVAAVADSRIRALGPAARARALARALATTPTRGWLRTLRALAAVAAGVLILVDPVTALRIVAVAGGLLLIALGVDEVLAQTALPPGERPAPGLVRRRRVATTALAVAAAAAPVLVLVATAGAGGERDGGIVRTTVGCNGSEALCDRRLDEVALPATHNSMSAPREGYLLPNQQSGIVAQLEGGIRGLLIDTHMGVRTDDGVFTLLEQGGKSRAKLEQALGAPAVRTAERLRGQISYEGGGDERVYLCHGFCELGATDAVSALEQIRDFLLTDPGAVVVLSIEDQVSPEDTAGVFERSGLLSLVWTDAVRPLPTLGEMVERNRRVLVLGEEETAGVPWYHQQFDLVKETPFDVPTAARLLAPDACRLNRGRERNPLLLVNQFVAEVPPLPSTARKVNGRDELVRHARECERAFASPVGLLAVDQWEEGDVVGAAEVLNSAPVAGG
jgi:hypothetical protein